MSLLSPTHSLMNNIMANARQITPEVGMGATKLMYTDRHACTVIEVVSPRKIRVQLDIAKRTDANGMSEMQAYSYAANPEGSIYTVTLRTNGRWVREGESAKNGQSFAVGYRQAHHRMWEKIMPDEQPIKIEFEVTGNNARGNCWTVRCGSEIAYRSECGARRRDIPERGDLKCLPINNENSAPSASVRRTPLQY